MDSTPLLPLSLLPPVAQVQTFQRKECLPAILDRVWHIEQGVVRAITWDENGHVTTLGLWGQGDITGQPLTRQHPCSFECLTLVKVIATSLNSLSHCWQSVLLRHLWHQEDLLKIVRQPSVLERLAQLLHWLAQRFGRPVPQGQLLDPLLTHQQLAEILGISRVTVTRALNRLEQDGLLVRFKEASGKRPNQASYGLPCHSLLLKYDNK
jgi:CRP-like cAMP-binding protein